MPVNIRPQSTAKPLQLDEAQYKLLVRKAEGGWSRCADDTEFLAKLHYLRAGFKAAKLAPEQFQEREFRLVQAFLQRYL